jgi:myo-inositol-1(or 4)-monophosphatase
LKPQKQAATDAGRNLLPHFGNVESLDKEGVGLGSVFTKLDVETEAFLHDRLGKFSKYSGLPIGFSGEEKGMQENGDLSWLVDPIDGTSHFVRGLPMCMTMIALVQQDKVLLAVIHDIANQSTYWATAGHGSYRDGKKLSVSTRSFSKSMLDFETRLDNPAYMEKYLQVRQQAVIVGGFASGFTFAMIASGKLDAKIGLDPYGEDWDFAPGSLLVREAGGVTMNIGKPGYDYRDHNFIIGNPKLYRELTEGKNALFPIP